jgi:hypothetical protein
VYDVYNSVFEFLPISRNFALPLKKEWDNIPQATINSLIGSMQVRCVALHMRQKVVTPDTDRFSDPRSFLF